MPKTCYTTSCKEVSGHELIKYGSYKYSTKNGSHVPFHMLKC